MFILKQTLSFDSDSKQWNIYMCVCLCKYTLQVITLTIYWLGLLFLSTLKVIHLMLKAIIFIS